MIFVYNDGLPLESILEIGKTLEKLTPTNTPNNSFSG
jgi:hypothetical protein